MPDTGRSGSFWRACEALRCATLTDLEPAQMAHPQSMLTHSFWCARLAVIVVHTAKMWNTKPSSCRTLAFRQRYRISESDKPHAFTVTPWGPSSPISICRLQANIGSCRRFISIWHFFLGRKLGLHFHLACSSIFHASALHI
jgi:hypothetical protein